MTSSCVGQLSAAIGRLTVLSRQEALKKVRVILEGGGNSEVTGSAVSVRVCRSVVKGRGSDIIATYVLTNSATCRRDLTLLTFGTEVTSDYSLPKFYKTYQSRPTRNLKLTDDFQYRKVNILLFNTFSVSLFLAKANLSLEIRKSISDLNHLKYRRLSSFMNKLAPHVTHITFSS